MSYLRKGMKARSGGLFSDMADGRAIRPEQPDPENAALPGRRGPPETVPEEVRKLWDLLPRRERQRRRQRFFRAHPACCSRPVTTPQQKLVVQRCKKGTTPTTLFVFFCFKPAAVLTRRGGPLFKI